MSVPLPEPLVPGLPWSALAPMQDVTDLAFMRLVARRGPPDLFFTEFFRVHAHSTLERHIVRSIVENDTGRPVFAQIIGESLPDIGRTIDQLQKLPIAGIDLNLGCPAPKVYRKQVGGGLLRDPARVDAILGFMRARVVGRLSVKMRIGFDSDAPFEQILDSVERHGVDLLSLHARTVKQLYRPGVRDAYHARAASRLRLPVLANGDIWSAARAESLLRSTGVAGVMVGRHAIRNPWIFDQIRRRLSGASPRPVVLAEVRAFVDELWETTAAGGVPETARVGRMKKYLNFVGQGVDPAGRFLHDMRRAGDARSLFAVCDQHLLLEPQALFADEPYPGVIARPNHEAEAEGCAG